MTCGTGEKRGLTAFQVPSPALTANPIVISFQHACHSLTKDHHFPASVWHPLLGHKLEWAFFVKLWEVGILHCFQVRHAPR